MAQPNKNREDLVSLSALEDFAHFLPEGLLLTGG